jgi:hypothetical protein
LLSLLRWNKADGGFIDVIAILFTELPSATATLLEATGVPKTKTDPDR